MIGTASSPSGWTPLYRVGGLAALAAGILFRRNLAAELELFSPQASPDTAGGWFALLQRNRLLGLAYLQVFDLLNYLLLALVFLALYLALRRLGRSAMAIATVLGLVGVAAYLASNTAFSMLSLSEQYAAATTEAQRATLLAAGEGLLALGRFTAPGSYPGTGGYINLLLIAVAGVIASVVMLRSDRFNRVAAVVGIVAGALDLAYCLAFVFLPMVGRGLLAMAFIPAAGLFWCVWHILVGLRLMRLGSSVQKLRPAPVVGSSSEG